MRFALTLLGGLAAVFGAPVEAAANEPLSIAGAEIPGVLEAGGGGPYEQFFEDIVSKGPVGVQLNLMPVKRLARSFFEKRSDCIYMSTDDLTFYEEHGTPLGELLASEPFNRIFLRAYTRRGVDLINSWNALEGKHIAGDMGIHVSSIAQRTLPFAKDILYTKTVDEAFELLAGRRVDVTIAYSIDARRYFDRSGKRAFQTDSSLSLLTLGEGVACWPSPRGQALISYVNDRVSELNHSGELTSIYGFEVGQ